VNLNQKKNTNLEMPRRLGKTSQGFVNTISRRSIDVLRGHKTLVLDRSRQAKMEDIGKAKTIIGRCM
jgi:hypothetical protein